MTAAIKGKYCQFRWTAKSKDVCNKRARYMVGWEHDGRTEWVPVCGVHDNVIGLRNLRSTGMTPQNAIKLDKQIREQRCHDAEL